MKNRIILNKIFCLLISLLISTIANVSFANDKAITVTLNTAEVAFLEQLKSDMSSVLDAMPSEGPNLFNNVKADIYNSASDKEFGKKLYKRTTAYLGGVKSRFVADFFDSSNFGKKITELATTLIEIEQQEQMTQFKFILFLELLNQHAANYKPELSTYQIDMINENLAEELREQSSSVFGGISKTMVRTIAGAGVGLLTFGIAGKFAAKSSMTSHGQTTTVQIFALTGITIGALFGSPAFDATNSFLEADDPFSFKLQAVGESDEESVLLD